MFRVFSVLFGLFASVALILFLTRLWGLSQVEAAYHHPFYDVFSNSRPSVFQEIYSLEGAKNFYYIRLHISEDQHFFFAPPNELQLFLKFKKEQQVKSPSQFIFKGTKIHSYLFKDIQSQTPNLMSFEDFLFHLSKNPQQRALINIEDNATNVDRLYTELINKYPELENQILTTSRIGIVVTSIKKLKPRWIYGSTQDDWMRLLTFNSLFILPSTPFQKDVFISPLKYMKRSIINQEIVDEMRRRNKKIILGPLHNQQEIETAKSFNPDGLILSEFELSSYL